MMSPSPMVLPDIVDGRVAVPAPADAVAELASVDQVPACQADLFSDFPTPCVSPAAWRLRLAHMLFAPQCAPRCALVCDEHRVALEAGWRSQLSIPGDRFCLLCMAPLRSLGDVVLSAVAL